MQRGFLALLLLTGLAGQAHAQAIAVSLAGRAMPSRLTLDSLRWDDEVVAAALAACPIGGRGTTYYFDNVSGNDTTGNGSQATPWKTLAKAETMLTTSDIALLFKRGVVWTETVGLTIDQDDITVGAYGSGARPLFNAFTSTLASGGTLWTVAAGNRYTHDPGAAIGGIRPSLDRFKALRKVASTAEVESTANSWFQSGTTISMHVTNAAGAAVDPDTIAWEYTLAGTTDDSAIDISSGSTGVRIDSIRADGWGLDGGVVNQEYAVKVQATGTDVVCVTNCGGYYQARHNLGHNAGNAAGGFVLWINNDCGYVSEAAGSPMVAYAGLGSQEDIFIGNTVAYGALPITAARTWADGTAIYAHADPSGTYDAALILAKDTMVEAPANGFGCNIGVQIDSLNLPTATAVTDCKGIIINTTMEKAMGTGANGSLGHAFNIANTVEIGGTYWIYPREMSTAAMTTINPSGWLIGTAIEIDMSAYAGAYFAAFNPSVTTTNPKYWHTQWNILHNGTTNFALNVDTVFNTSIADDAGEFVNSIFAVHRANPALTASPSYLTGNVGWLGLGNSATALRNNAFFGVSDDGANTSSSLAVNTVQLGSMPVFGQTSLTQGASQLASEGEGGIIEFDSLLRSRHPTEPSIGPVEFAAQDLQNPTVADILTLFEELEDRDHEPVQHLWQLKRSGDGSLRSTNPCYVHAGDTIRVGWNCGLPSILPGDTGVASQTDPAVVDNEEDITVTTTGPGEKVAKAEVTVTANATAGSYWVSTGVTNTNGGGPVTVYGEVIVQEAP